jgi:parallel beta-helix repeat protein/predicted outer membrane repeat protein
MYGGEISGNVSQNSGAGIVIEGRATMNMSGGVITGNKSVKGNGGGVFISTNSFFNMTGGEISKNICGGSGAGIYGAKNSTSVITGGKITGNKADKGCGGGAVIQGENAKMTINGITISGNTARYGGAIWLRDGAQMQIKSCKITGNSSQDQGGALYASANSTVTINGGTLSYNSSKFGGAFYVSAAKVKMNGTTIVGNKAVERNGGAAVIARTQVNKKWVLSTVTLNNCYVANNEAKASGGGFVVEGQGDTLNINGGTLTQNKSFGGDGGAVYASSKTILNITGAKIEKNSAQGRAGALRVADYATATVKDTVFDGNTAAMQGGAICHWNASGLYENVTMSNNTSGEMGGGIIIRGNSLLNTDLYSGATLRNCTIKDNEAVLGGGVGMNGLMKGVLENCTISGNHTTQTGGGIIVGPSSSATLTNCVISDNSADDRGGGIHLYCRLVMDNCQITNNYAVGNGGGICTVKCATPDFLFKDTGAFLNNVQVSGNRSDREGGGVYLFGGCNGFLTDVTITDNTSRAGASGLYAGYDLTAKNLTVTGNKGGDYAVKMAEANYDGASYQSGHKDMSGLVKITDNVGGDLYIPTQTVLVLSTELAEGSRIDVTLADGVITNRVLGMYDYEGSNLVYTLTPGMRSITDPEKEVAAPEVPNEDTADNEQTGENTMLYVGVVAFAVVIIAAAVILVVLSKKKKKAVETADSTQE